MKRKIKISEKYHFINVLDENIFQGCKVARLQNRGLFLVEDMRMKRERSAKRRMESAKCRPINDNIKEKKFVLRAVSHGAEEGATHMIDSLGYRLKQLRQERKLKQGQVADIIGVNKRQISAYENDSRQPSYDILIRLAVLYHVSTDYLLGFQVSNRTLDVSGLTRAEYTMIADLVESMSEKNKKLEDM